MTGPSLRKLQQRVHHPTTHKMGLFVCLFDLIPYVPSTTFQLNRHGISWVEPVLSYGKCVFLKDHNAVTLVRLEPTAPRSQVKHSTTEPLCSLRWDCNMVYQYYKEQTN